MTLGIDVSRLFTEMMLAIETRDLVVKKMVYLYLCTYARQKPDLAIMCINTLQRDWYVRTHIPSVGDTSVLLSAAEPQKDRGIDWGEERRTDAPTKERTGLFERSSLKK